MVDATFGRPKRKRRENLLLLSDTRSERYKAVESNVSKRLSIDQVGDANVVDEQRNWLFKMEEQSLEEAIVRMQALVRGRAARLQHGDELKTALLLAAARAQIDAAAQRARRLVRMKSYLGFTLH